MFGVIGVMVMFLFVFVSFLFLFLVSKRVVVVFTVITVAAVVKGPVVDESCNSFSRIGAVASVLYMYKVHIWAFWGSKKEEILSYLWQKL